MNKKMFSILASSVLLLHGNNSLVLANDNEEIMVEIEDINFSSENPIDISTLQDIYDLNLKIKLHLAESPTESWNTQEILIDSNVKLGSISKRTNSYGDITWSVYLENVNKNILPSGYVSYSTYSNLNNLDMVTTNLLTIQQYTKNILGEVSYDYLISLPEIWAVRDLSYSELKDIDIIFDSSEGDSHGIRLKEGSYDSVQLSGSVNKEPNIYLLNINRNAYKEDLEKFLGKKIDFKEPGGYVGSSLPKGYYQITLNKGAEGNWYYADSMTGAGIPFEVVGSSSSTASSSSNSSSSNSSSSASNSSITSSSSSSNSSSSNSNGGSSTVTTSKPKLSVTAGSVIEKTDGSLNNKELKTLESYIEAHNNPYGYEFTINNASVSTKDGQSTFTMSVTAKLDDESHIDLAIRNLKKRNRSEDAMIEEDEFVEFSDLEEMEAASLDYDYVYDKDGDGKKVVIKGIAAKDAFRINDNLNGTSVRTILNDAGYKVSNLNFNSSSKKNHTFSIKDLDNPISIEVTTSTQSSTVSTPSKPVGGDGIIQLPSTPSQPTTPAPTVVAQKPVYRFFNTLTGEHFYTSSEAERNELMKDSRWSYEGQAWTAPESSEYIIYRVCNPNTGEHHFTMDKNEYETLQTRGWRGEGIGFYSANPSDENIVHLYRLYNPKANNAGSHHYTASEIERDNLVKDGWNYEGVAWYGLK